jgi:hypothetical protein
MKIYFALLALLGVFLFSILFLADRERKAGAERLSYERISPAPRQQSAPDPSTLSR